MEHPTSRVFIVQNPYKQTPAGPQPKFDFRTARAFGATVVLLGPDVLPLDGDSTVHTLRIFMRDFGPQDFLLLAGHPLFNAWAAVIAAEKCDGTLNTLVWDSPRQKYVRSSVKIFDCESTTCKQS